MHSSWFPQTGCQVRLSTGTALEDACVGGKKNQQAMASAQAAYDNALPVDDLDFLDDDKTDFDREEEEALAETGAGRVIDPEQLWAALRRKPEFRAVLDTVINEMMDNERYQQARDERMKLDAEQRMEP